MKNFNCHEIKFITCGKQDVYIMNILVIKGLETVG
jgi:hypothetical protein